MSDPIPKQSVANPSGQSRPAMHPFRSRVVGFLVLIGSIALGIGSLAWAAYSFSTESSDLVMKTDFELALIGLCLGIGGIVVGRKMMAPDALTVMARDPRPPVVFLRPFEEDKRRNYSQPLGARLGGRDLAVSDNGPSGLEAKLAKPLRRIGPFVSVGAPGDKLAPLGSARIYLADEDWQSEVEKLVKSAAAIVLQPDVTEGTKWELRKVAQLVDPRRLLVLVPNPKKRPLGYARIQYLTAEAFPQPLPIVTESIDAFMFDDTGKPHPLELASGGRLGRFNGRALDEFVDQVSSLPSVLEESP